MSEKDDRVPDELSARLKLAAKMAAKETFAKMNSMREIIGKQTLVGTRGVSQEELDNRMTAIRTNKEALIKVLVDNMQLSELDGRPMIRKEFMNQYRRVNDKFTEAGLA